MVTLPLVIFPVILGVPVLHADPLLQSFDLRPFDFADTGRGLQTTRERRSGEVVLQIGIEDTWTAARFVDRFPPLRDYVSTCTDEEMLALGLCSLLKVEDPYASSLPRPHHSIFTMPDDLWEVTRKCLPRCYQEIFLAKRAAAHDMCEKARHIPKEDLLWAFSMVRSRSVSAPALAETKEEVPNVLIPCFDLLNHKFGAKTTLSLQNNANTWRVLANEPYQKGDQVWLSYGDDKDNWKLLLTYGFCMKENPNKFVFWDFEDLLAAAAEARPKLFSPEIQQALREHPQLQPYMHAGEQRPMFSYDMNAKGPRESLTVGLGLLENVSRQLGQPDDPSLAQDVLDRMMQKRQEELILCLGHLRTIEKRDPWLGFFASLQFVLEQEGELLEARK